MTPDQDATTMAEGALRALLSDVGWPDDDAARVTFRGADDLYACRFPAGVATGVALAAAGLALPGPRRRISVDLDHAALMSEGYRHVRLDGASVAAPRDALTGFYDTRDGRALFLHVNFPHHRARALDLLGAAPDRDSIAAQVKTWDGASLDAALADAGAIAALALTAEEWDASPQGRAIAQAPLIEIARIGDGPARPFDSLRDVSVVDFTRVLAGPTCGRFLAEAGARVTRVEHPQTPDLTAYKLDANRDKQELTLDLRRPDELARLRAMATHADVFVQAYKPGVAAHYGVDAHTLAAANDGVIHASLSAFGHDGPWAMRRGFDSVAQAATGLALAHGGDAPKLMPTSPLDYVAGFLLAFGVEVALHRRAREGGGYRVRTSLARVADWLRKLERAAPPTPDASRLAAIIAAQSTQTRRPMGLIRHLRSAMTFADEDAGART